MAEMTTQDIVRKSDAMKNKKFDWKQIYSAMHQTIKNNTHRVVRVENTLFWVKLLPENEVTFMAFSSEPDSVQKKHFEEFKKAINAAGLKVARGQ